MTNTSSNVNNWTPAEGLRGVAVCFIGGHEDSRDDRIAIEYFYDGLRLNENGDPLPRNLRKQFHIFYQALAQALLSTLL